jgi:C-terminal processing protease CtpA/Prc
MKGDKFFLRYSFIHVVLVLSFFVAFYTSCTKDKEPSIISSEDSIYVVIDEIMNSWYLWYTEVPDIDIFQFNEPSDLMDALMYKPIDKWSFVENKEVIDAMFEEGETFGFGFNFRFDPDGNLRIIYVYEESEAYDMGFRKGYIVYKINGIPSKSFDNFDEFFDETPVTYTFEIIDFNGIHEEITLSKKTIHENGVFYQDVFDVAGHKTGYLVYDSFLGYTEEELNEAFQIFKDNHITDLIVDLRYNLGGYISLAEQLAEMTAPLTAVDEPMYSLVHNNLVGPYEDTTINFSLLELNLNLNRIFFLTTQYTASASELVINTLEPYMDVYLIGTPTYGKPVGMYGFLFHDWYIYPVTAKLENADGFGDYFNGLQVDCYAGEGLDKDWGDQTDPCLSQALHFISFGTFDEKASFDLKSTIIDEIPSMNLKGRHVLILNR